MAAAIVTATLSLSCSFFGRTPIGSDPVPTVLVESTIPIPPTAKSTLPVSTRTLYLPYASGGQQAWELGPGEPLRTNLPVSVGSFYGFSPVTNRILYAAVFSDHGAGPDTIAVSDLAICDPTTGASTALLTDNVVEALWAPNGHDLAYILATPETYELRWRTEAGDDRLLARDVTFNWSIAPSGEAVAFTRESRYSLTRDPGLYVVRVADAAEVKVSDADPQGFGSVSDQPIWSSDSAWVTLATAEPSLSLAHADGSGAIDLQIDPALESEWWATAAIPNFLWFPDGERMVAAPAAGQSEMGGPSPLVVYELDLEQGLLHDGVLVAEIGALIGWDVPGQSVWVTSIDGIPERISLP
jgi:hypothetical protein